MLLLYVLGTSIHFSPYTTLTRVACWKKLHTILRGERKWYLSQNLQSLEMEQMKLHSDSVVTQLTHIPLQSRIGRLGWAGLTRKELSPLVRLGDQDEAGEARACVRTYVRTQEAG